MQLQAALAQEQQQHTCDVRRWKDECEVKQAGTCTNIVDTPSSGIQGPLRHNSHCCGHEVAPHNWSSIPCLISHLHTFVWLQARIEVMIAGDKSVLAQKMAAQNAELQVRPTIEI